MEVLLGALQSGKALDVAWKYCCMDAKRPWQLPRPFL